MRRPQIEYHVIIEEAAEKPRLLLLLVKINTFARLHVYVFLGCGIDHVNRLLQKCSQKRNISAAPVHFYRNIFSATPRSKMKLVAKMLKAIHAQKSKAAAREKAKSVVEDLRAMKLKEAAKKLEDGIEETLTYMDFPYEHWTRIRTNNAIERLNKEIRRRTRVVGTFPDGNSALVLVCARLRHVAGTQ